MRQILSGLCLFIFYIIVVNVLGLSRTWVSIPIKISVCGFLLYLLNHVINHVNRQPDLIYEPITLTIQHHVIRIPLEDRVDLDLDDNHNVHNKTIKRTAVMAITALQEVDLHKYSIHLAMIEIDQYITEQLADSTKLKTSILYLARKNLRSINDMNVIYSTADLPECEIIRLVWERINHPINTNRIQILKENFINQLADCRNQESGGLHCCEGRITRLLQSLQACDHENIVNLRPMWAFKDEIANRISLYRNKLLSKVPQKYRELETKSEFDEQDRLLVTQFNQCLIKNLEKRFEIDYLQPGYLHPKELTDLTQVYYDSLYDY